MNQAQRKFLIDRIKSKTDEKIKELHSQLRKMPSAPNYIFRAILNCNLKLRSEEHILYVLKHKALKAKEGENWLVGKSSWGNENEVSLNVHDLIEIPEDYSESYVEANQNNRKIEEQIRELKMQFESIEVRIQLASDKTLEKMISEVDDMGSLSLIDTKLKLLN